MLAAASARTAANVVPETLMPALAELEAAYRQVQSDPDFWLDTVMEALKM